MDSHVPRLTFVQEKSELEQSVLDMVARADAQVSKAVDALVRLDKNLAHEAMMGDDEIDRRDLEIESRCIRIFALQQPMGADLREIGTILKIITDIERIGDLAVDIAKTTLKVDAELGNTNYVDLKLISEIARQMLRESIQAFVRRDPELLPQVGKLENQVDSYYRDLREQIHNYMRSHPDQVVAASWMLLAVHHIERIADHALNIAERVGYMITGELVQLGRSDIEPSGEDEDSSVF